MIAGYHWFTDWGRDTMISLEGLTLATGRHDEAGLDPAHLRALRPRRPDSQPVSRRREAKDCTTPPTRRCGSSTRWTATCAAPATARTLKLMLPRLVDIVRAPSARNALRHRRGPGGRPAAPGAEGYQLTWMDAKVDDWVVTPRRGKAVEINALWYNALRLLEDWLREEDARRPPATHRRTGRRARESFNRRFWYDQGGYLYDVVDGETAATIRPAGRTRLLAISLDSSGARPRRAGSPVLDVVRERLLTPVGLRSLAPGHPDYKPKYYGDLRARDAAYHQGTVWAWLIGPYVDAWQSCHPGEEAEARRFWKASSPIWTRPASAPSARSSTPNRRTRRAAASPRHGASPKCCGCWVKKKKKKKKIHAGPGRFRSFQNRPIAS